MKVLFAYYRGSNWKYLLRVIDMQAKMFKGFSFVTVNPTEYLAIDQDSFDILIYNTFPDENHSFKFDKELVRRMDEKFWDFKGVKVLADSFGWGDKDGFERMGEEGLKLPRVKHLPSFSFLKKSNVILSCPVYVGDVIEDMPDGERDVIVHCAFHLRGYPHNIRPRIMDVLRRDFSNVTNFDRISRRQYLDFLRRTLISVNAPGDGPCSDTFYYAIKSGALTFAEETMDNHKLLPKDTLIEGEHYVSFSLDTLSEKLRYLLDNPKECDRIRKSGHEKLKEGYDLEKTSKDFHLVLENLCRN